MKSILFLADGLVNTNTMIWTRLYIALQKKHLSCEYGYIVEIEFNFLNFSQTDESKK